MNSKEFRNAILLKRPRYAVSREEVIEAFANKGKSKSEYSQFGPVYELYVFAFVIGIKKGLKLPLPTGKMTKNFLEIGKWKTGSGLVEFLLMIMFTRREELELSWFDLEHLEDDQLNKEIDKIIDLIEMYANGGLEYLERQWKDGQLINSSYLFSDILADVSGPLKRTTVSSDIVSDLNNENLVEDTIRKIKEGESSVLEFKSSLRVNLFTGKPDRKMEHSVMKTIAAFLNTKHGTLLIGVADTKEILGIKPDLLSFDKDDKIDAFQLHLDNLIQAYLDNAVFSNVEINFPEIRGKRICRIDVAFRANRETYLNKDKENKEFYIRRSSSTVALKLDEIADYIGHTWRGG